MADERPVDGLRAGGIVGARVVAALLGTILVLGGGLLCLLALVAWTDIIMDGGTLPGTALFATLMGGMSLLAGLILGRQAGKR